jgi:predicted PurR-regulated permease PerM
VIPESRYWLIIVLVASFCWLLYLLAPVLTPFAVAATLAYMGDPLVDRVEEVKIFKWHINRPFAVSVVFIGIFFILISLFLVIIPVLIEQMHHLIKRIPEWSAWTSESVLPWMREKLGLESLDFGVDTVKSSLLSYWKEASTALAGVLGTVSAGGQAILHWLMNLVLIPVVTFYLLRDWDKLVAGIHSLLPPAIEPTVTGLTREIDEVLGAFIRGQLMVMVVLGLIYTLGLWVIGVDLAFIIGMGAGLLSIVPYLGTFVGLVAAVAASLFQFQDVFHPMMALVVFSIGQMLEGMVLTPKLVGDKVGLHPVAVIFAVLAGGQLFGFLGILLALPVASALNVVIRHANQRYRSSDLFRDDSMIEGAD